MKSYLVALVVCFLVGAITGCKKDQPPTDPGPPQPGGGQVSEVEPNDVAAQALGFLGSTDFIVSGSASTSNDVDLFSVQLSAIGNLHVSLNWSPQADLDVGVMNGNAIMLNFQDSGAKPEQCTLSSRPAGTYIIRVTSKTGSATPYTLTIGLR